MSHKCFQFFIIPMLCYSMLYTPVFSADQLALPPDDIDSPEIIHDIVTETFKSGKVQPITATVTDNVGVKSVVLFYRQKGTERYQQAIMQRVGTTDQYSVTLDALFYTAPGIEYYIQAMDTAGNRLLHGYAFSPMNLSFETVEGPAINSTTDILLSSSTDKISMDNSAETKSTGNYKWLWIGLGVLAVGALAGGGGGDDSPPPTSSLDIQVPTPSGNSN